MQNKLSLNSVLVFIVVTSVVGCSVAKFETVKHFVDGSDKVTQSEVEENGTELIDTKDSQQLTTLECNGIAVKDYPKAHQKVSLNPADSNQPSEFVLRFDNQKIISLLDHQHNYRKNLRLLSWAATQRITVDINMDPVSWSKTAPTDPELDCILTKEISVFGNPESVVVRMEKFEDQNIVSERLKSYFATEQDGYTLICQKNHRTQDRDALSPMTLAKINKLLCGIGTIYKK